MSEAEYRFQLQWLVECAQIWGCRIPSGDHWL